MTNDTYVRVSQIVNDSKTGKRGILNISRSFFLNQVKKGRFPNPIKLSSRVVVWKRSEIEEFTNEPLYMQPRMTENQNTDSSYETWLSKHGGYANSMTMRDYFAAKAMQSFTADVGRKSDQQWFEEIAEGAYRQADAMLKAREK